jgi:hypothetical protein
MTSAMSSGIAFVKRSSSIRRRVPDPSGRLRVAPGVS